MREKCKLLFRKFTASAIALCMLVSGLIVPSIDSLACTGNQSVGACEANIRVSETSITKTEINISNAYKLTGKTKKIPSDETPYAKHGKLHVKGVNLYDEHNKKFQLRGVSLHGLQWDVGYNYINKASFRSMRDEWGVNAVRLPVYVTQTGYTEGSAADMDTRIENAVKYATDLGMYVIIDWHVHDAYGGGANPNTWINDAKTFFKKYASKYKKNGNILYEICNEPVNTQWFDGSGNDLYSYANTIIPIIRKYTKAVVIVGTNTWSQDVDQVIGHKIDAKNVMYTIHFYSATHTDYLRQKVQTAIDGGVPVFCTEFGVCTADGNGWYDFNQADEWIKLFDKNNISYFCWHLSNKGEKSALLNTACTKISGGWTNSDLSEAGSWLVNTYRAKEAQENSKVKYTIKFNGNGATSGKMTKMSGLKYSKRYALKANTYKKKGYKFVGWNTRKNGKGISYKNKAKIKGLTTRNGKTITLYAQWKKK